MKRKPIQITAAANGLVAVCDDGSIWAWQEGREWERLLDIPQDAPVEPQEALVQPRQRRWSTPKPAELPPLHTRSVGSVDARARVLDKIAAEPGLPFEVLIRSQRGMSANIVGTCVARLLSAGFIAGPPKVGPFTATERGVEALKEPALPAVATLPRPRLGGGYQRQAVTIEQVADALRRLVVDHPEGVGPQAIVDELKPPVGKYIAYVQVQQLMVKLLARGEIRKIGRGQYLAVEATAPGSAPE